MAAFCVRTVRIVVTVLPARSGCALGGEGRQEYRADDRPQRALAKSFRDELRRTSRMNDPQSAGASGHGRPIARPERGVIVEDANNLTRPNRLEQANGWSASPFTGVVDPAFESAGIEVDVSMGIANLRGAVQSLAPSKPLAFGRAVCIDRERLVLSRRNTPGPVAKSRSLGDVLSFMQLLWAISHGLESASKRMRSTVGVTGPQRLVLRLIGRYGQTAPGDLAEMLHVDPSSLTGVLRRLERAGLIRRARDPKDGRRAILTLTPAGLVLNDRRSGTVEASIQKTLQGVSAAKVAVAREVLNALARDLGVETELPSRARPVVAVGTSSSRARLTGARRGARRP